MKTRAVSCLNHVKYIYYIYYIITKIMFARSSLSTFRPPTPTPSPESRSGPPAPTAEQVMYMDMDGNMRACSGRVESVTDRVRTPPRLPPSACRSWWRRNFSSSCRPSYETITYDKCIIVEDFSTIQYKKQNKNDCVLLIIAIILLILFLLESKY